MIHDQRDETSDEATPLPPASGPLPPIPDGGLARAMPGWLREAPETAAHASTDSGTIPASSPEAGLDPAGFITEADLPDWLRHLGTSDSPPPSAAASTVPARPSLPAPSAPVATGSTAQRAPARPTAPIPAATVGRRVDLDPGPSPDSNLAAQPRRDPGPTGLPTASPFTPRAPTPTDQQDDPNRAVAIIGIVLVVVAAVIIIYLFATGIL